MNSKSYAGIVVFIFILICILHMYQRTELTDLSLKRNLDFSNKKAVQGDSSSSTLHQTPAINNHEQTVNLSASTIGGRFEDNDQQNLMTRIADLYSSNSAYFDYHLERQEQRRTRLRDVCHSMGVVKQDEKPYRNIWVSDKYKFVYCSIPKVACTSWKSVLLVLEGLASSTDEFSQSTINRKSGKWMKQLWKYPKKEQKTILKTYTKFMFSRDPFSRILSAFRNKLSPNSTFERAGKWQKKLGEFIIHRYRENRHKGDPYDLTFSEFAKFISSGNRLNKHWNLQFRQCTPCDMNYTILGHFETLQEDSAFILKVVGAESDVSFPSSNHSSPTNSSDESIFKSFYESLSNVELRHLYKTYSKDFELFSYPLPERLNSTE